jgi:hypothetical protein
VVPQRLRAPGAYFGKEKAVHWLARSDSRNAAVFFAASAGATFSQFAGEIRFHV